MELAEARMNICKECPLYLVTEYGPRCNKRKFIHPDGRTSWLPKEGFVQGCNCLLEKRTQSENEHCIVNK